MTHLIKIGNSQGIRIPQALIQQAHLENQELTLQVVENGLLITPIKKARAGWEEQFKNLSCLEIDQANQLDHSAELATGEAWEW
ncbi:MAG: AbrB/MazE/SpoVT family DNA-binding domain-containing protein [Methylovulum miyakonense]|uniref:AbrB/MazE/SpoVT family DNA-binding domain-containing protein n=1 Tax=Methylovulum miyakonense TaxID=645578 RepID=UPI003BB4BAED